jgi:copper transport protein
VSVTFDEPVDLIPRALVLTNDHGIPVPLEPARLVNGRELRADLPNPADAGGFAVVWRVRTDDGHIESGSFRFELGVAAAASHGADMAAAPAAPMSDPAEPLWPVLVAIGLAAAAGVGAFVVVRRGLRAFVTAGGAYPGDPITRASPEEHAASQE